MAKHKVITTNAEISRAIQRAGRLQEEPKLLEVYYNSDPRFDVFVLKLSDGSRHFIGREKLQGLQDATRKQIAKIEIAGNGTGLRWPELDLDFYVPNLLCGIYGNKQWTSETGHRDHGAKRNLKSKAAQRNGLRSVRAKKATVA